MTLVAVDPRSPSAVFDLEFAQQVVRYIELFDAFADLGLGEFTSPLSSDNDQLFTPETNDGGVSGRPAAGAQVVMESGMR
jgi:hypothetical protein